MTTATRIAVAGNPNVGKTSLFNRLTGLRYQVGNYPGVTVEVRDGALHDRHGVGGSIQLLDLPGCYSLTPQSQDEAVAYRALAGIDTAAPDAALVVLDATNLARNLYLLGQIRDLGLPCVVALNMADLAEAAGLIDARHEFAARLSASLGVPVVPTVAAVGEGVAQIAEQLGALDPDARPAPRPVLLPGVDAEGPLATALEGLGNITSPGRARWLVTAMAAAASMAPDDEARLTRVSDTEKEVFTRLGPAATMAAARELIAVRYAEVEARLAEVGAGATNAATSEPVEGGAMAWSERIDRVLTHRVAGPLVFVGVMATVFQSIFTWAEPFIGAIEWGVGWLADTARSVLGPGMFTDVLTEGVIAGVGNVVVFVPQIALLFLFVSLLEETGYMARAAFIIDRVMSKVGLNGKAFVPLLGGYACAVPAIMSTRTISSFKDRLVTILMIPYMSCSARLPIYALLIGAMFDADRLVWGPFSVGGLVLLAMYGLSTLSALVIGAIYKRTLLRSPTPPLVLELPPYRLPRLRNTLTVVWDRTWAFLRDAGTVILAFTIVLWALLTFPQVDPAELEPGETAIEHSVAGRVGKALEPALTPIGQDWRMGIGIIGSFAAREVFVSTLGLVYGMEGDVDEDDTPLREAIRTAEDPSGEPRHSRLSAVALMVFFVYACQCMSTLAVVKRETAGWRWPTFMFFSMTIIAYVMALLTYQLGRMLGF